MMRKFAIATVFALLALTAVQSRAEWTKQNTNSFAWFRDIFFVNANNGWIVGGDGIVLSTADGGTSWTQAKKFTNDNILQVHFVNENNGWLLCERNIYARGKDATSYLRHTTDGGATWEKVEFLDGGHERVTKLVFNADGQGMAFGEGGMFFKLQEDGVSWKKNATSIHFLLLDGAFSPGRVGAIVGSGGTILFTEDSGFTWEKASLLGDVETRLNSVVFSGDRGAWAVGSGGHVFHSNGGARLWRQQDSTVTADLNDVFFTSTTNGWAVGDHGVIIRTRDGGTTWNDVNSHVTHRLEKILFENGRGWAIGFGGTVLTYSESGEPSDPSRQPILVRRG